jgi:hypothetical protein
MIHSSDISELHFIMLKRSWYDLVAFSLVDFDALRIREGNNRTSFWIFSCDEGTSCESDVHNKFAVE